MANSYEQGTVEPYLPASLVAEGEWPTGVTWEEVYGEKEGFVYMYVEDGCYDWDGWAEELRKLLVKWKKMPKNDAPEYLNVSVAYYCDKMRQGEFGGFAYFITVTQVSVMSVGNWLFEQSQKYLKKEIQ